MSTHARRVLVSILVVGTVLRVAAAWNRPLLGDELNIALAVRESYGHLLTHYGGRLSQPVYTVLAKLSDLLLGGWIGNEAALRVPALVAGVLGLHVCYRLVECWSGPGAAAWAAAALAVHPYHVFYSQMAVTYSLSATLCLGSMLAFERVLEAGRGRSAAGYVAVTAAAILSHAGCLGVVLAQLASLLPRSGIDARLCLRAAAAMAAAVALGLLWYLSVLSDVVAFRETWTGDRFALNQGHAALTMTAWAGGARWTIYLYFGLALLGLGATLCAPGGGRRWLVSALFWPLGVALFYLLNRADHREWAYARFLFVALPPVVVLAALGARVLWRASTAGSWPRRAAAASVLVATAALHVGRTIEIAWGPRDTRWDQLIARIRERLPREALIVHCPLRYNSFPHYAEVRPVGRELTTLAELGARLSGPAAGQVSLRRPIAYVVDLIAFDGPRWRDGWTAERFGTNTLLYREDAGTRRSAMRDMHLLCVEAVEQLRALPPLDDWIWWRIDFEHQNAFDRRHHLETYDWLTRCFERGEVTEVRTHDPVEAGFGGLLLPRLPWR